MKTRKWLFFPLTSLVILPGLMAGSWILAESAIEATSGQEFCSACHTMRPFAETYALDVHGGSNPRGLTTACSACHLPHDSPASYLMAKVNTGIHDGLAQMIAIFKAPDWIANLERRSDYVHDSGCLVCHSRLDQAKNQKPTAAFAHQTYFSGQDAMRCVTCHAHVGHRDLLQHLSARRGEIESAKPQAEAIDEPAQ
ncbi:cytochrome c3 family protein [Thiocystis violascens]|uniref:Nitrate/TMAO reductase, membrane-bound tetraheme cytochrome c subunit n=1 Tax=Thiocystis violascens (strain ATCC 17096 / DSM 198 / 6111) TaxID=765911 RepID=I3Y7S7_THIV6|nr:NapC/NirT family cytochrome c [Thiocystis violascens]AFL73045.1 nitrate/TMAO reductase, membrane-bound tetraheme cytochrome c subunit [Thiocystis violascens DSM 198]